MIALTEIGYVCNRVQELTGLVVFVAYRPWEMIHTNWVSRLTILGKVWMEAYTYMVLHN